MTVLDAPGSAIGLAVGKEYIRKIDPEFPVWEIPERWNWNFDLFGLKKDLLRGRLRLLQQVFDEMPFVYLEDGDIEPSDALPDALSDALFPEQCIPASGTHPEWVYRLRTTTINAATLDSELLFMGGWRILASRRPICLDFGWRDLPSFETAPPAFARFLREHRVEIMIISWIDDDKWRIAVCPIDDAQKGD